ncbi:DNA-binding XRE family transcriptional regulator [Paenarthrobacter sp. TE4293]|uniref:helix-turn-helix domain-containing protein n=1 Tax=Paenarthrobacter sp. TE4293 TaxID=3381695 RepID=UPI003D1EC256
MFEELAESLGLEIDSPSLQRAEYLADQDLDLLTALVAVRKERGLTQKVIAERLGVSQASIASFEKHGNDPKLSTIRKYAHAVGALVAHRVESDSGQLQDSRRAAWTPVHLGGALNVTEVNFGQTRPSRQMPVPASFKHEFALGA